MKRRRKRTTHQRRAAKFRTRLQSQLKDAIHRHAVLGVARDAVIKTVEAAVIEMRTRGYTDDDIDNAVKKAWATCIVEYRERVDRMIRREACFGNAYAFFVKTLRGGTMAMESDMQTFGIGPEDVEAAVHDSVAAVMRPARRRSDVV